MREARHTLSAIGGLRAQAATLSLLLSLLHPAATAEEPGPAELLVMLQGDDLQAISRSVEARGGEITHRLPIIDAIGARMSREQLDAVRAELPALKRVIDDLAWEPEPEPAAPGECGLAAAIALRWDGARATWMLYNKGDSALRLDSVSASWPEETGAPKTAFAGDTALHAISDPAAATEPAPASDTREADGERTALRAATPVTLAANSRLPLVFEFDTRPESPNAIQGDFALRARVSEECQTRLVPSYREPGRDNYFAAVSGAALLHSHGITGEGITVAVLDSGLWEHAELARNSRGEHRVLARYDAIAGREVDEAFDESGHGTHMTSVLARSGRVTRADAPQPSYRGIAPDVDLVAVKAFGGDGEAGFLDIVRGVQWVVENRERFGIRVLNLSFAARPRWPYWEDPVNQALMRAWQAGLFIAAAAGNEGPEPMTVGSPGNLPYLLTVGAFTDSWTETDPNDDYVPDFSSRGPTPMGHIKPDLVAAGGHMAGLTRPGSTLAVEFPEYYLDNGDFVMTGTSQATALVSGLAALMLQLEPGLNNNEIKCMLRTSAEPAIDEDGRLSYSPFIQGDGRVSLQRALTLGDRRCEQNVMNLAADIAGLDHYEGPAIFTEDAPPSLPGEEELIGAQGAEEGPSTQRRWGAKAHLSRLTRPGSTPTISPIDWAAVYAEEERRIRQSLSKNTDNH